MLILFDTLKILKSYIFKFMPFFIICIFFGINEVYAQSNYDNFNLPNSAYMWNIVSNTSVNKGERANVVDSINYEYRVIPFGTLYNYQNLGTTLGFSTDIVFQLNHTYTIQIAVATGGGTTNRYFTLGGVEPNLWVTSADSSGFYNFGRAVPLLYESYSYTEELINSQDFSNLTIFTLQFKPMYNFNNIVLNLNLNSSGSSLLYFLGYKITDNGIDNTQELNNINNSINDVNDSITSSDVDTGALDDTHVNNDNGVLSAILTLPIDFFQTLINGLSGYDTCPNLNFNLPFIDYPVSLPCVRTLIDKLGATAFWESIGLLAGGLTMFYYLIHLGKELSDMMTLNETRAEWGGL